MGLEIIICVAVLLFVVFCILVAGAFLAIKAAEACVDEFTHQD